MKIKKGKRVISIGISLRGQIRVLRALLLATIIVNILYFNHFQRLYLEIQNYYQASIDSDRILREQYQEMLQRYQELFDLVRKIYDTSQPALEECSLYLQVN